MIKSDFGSVVLGRGRFFGDAVPEGVGFSKGGFDVPGRKEVVDVGFVAAVVASVRADTLSDQFLDCGDKVGQTQTGKSVVCSL